MIYKNLKISLITFLFFILFALLLNKQNTNDFKPKTSNFNLQKTNESRSKINNIYFEEITNNGDFIKSKLYYQKYDEFYFESFWLNKKESEVGLYDGIFWFWIKRFDSKNFYFCKQKDVKKTRLKSVLNPFLIKTFTTIDEIKPDLIFKENEQTIILETKDDFLIKYYFNENIYKQEIYKDSLIILTCEFIDFYLFNEFVLPKKIKVVWHEENICATLNFSKPQINIAPKKINIPELNINLLGY